MADFMTSLLASQALDPPWSVRII